jgi:transposase
MEFNFGLVTFSQAGGRPRNVELRAVLNALFYLPASGRAWRVLPRDFLKWQTVYHYFRQSRESGRGKKYTSACMVDTGKRGARTSSERGEP